MGTSQRKRESRIQVSLIYAAATEYAFFDPPPPLAQVCRVRATSTCCYLQEVSLP